jgi:hypothetical protein
VNWCWQQLIVSRCASVAGGAGRSADTALNGTQVQLPGWLAVLLYAAAVIMAVSV